MTQCRPQVKTSRRLQLILQALKVTEASLSDLPPQLRLPVAVTCFWLQSAQPAPEETLLEALLLWLSDGDALRHGAGGTPRSDQRNKPLLVSDHFLIYLCVTCVCDVCV